MSAELVMGFDYGRRRIGVAVGNQLTASARGVGVVEHHEQPDWQQIETLIEEWRPQALVVGLPLGMDGSEQDMTQAAQAFAAALRDRFKLPVQMMDERLSSREANRRLAERRATGALARRVRKGDTDTTAAAVILEDWLNRQ